MNCTTGAGTWITAGAGEMYSTATFCGNCRGVWGLPAPCPLPLGPLRPLSKRPAATASNLARICFNTPERSVNCLWEQMDFRLRLRPLNAQILQDRRQDRGGGQEASWVMIVEATLDANWRSSLTNTPKEVDTFYSNCATLWIEKTVWYAKPLELWPGPESSSERILHKARDSMRSDVPPVTPSGEARDDCHGMRWWRHHLKTSLVVPTQSTPSSRL